MTFADVTAPDVLEAISEFDRLGRAEFLASTGFGTAREYFIVHGGERYDSKAIVGYAHQVAHGVPLGPKDFSGGDKTVAKLLRDLGWRQLGDTDPRVVTLPALLQSPVFHPIDGRSEKFRNPAGVARKTADIATRHPEYPGKATNGNRLDKVILDEFRDHPEEMRAHAAAVRILLKSGEAAELPPITDPDLEDHSAEEGRLLLRQHLRRERDPKLKRSKIADAKRRGQAITCEVCDFDFHRTYGVHGKDYIECHHRTPLFVTGQTTARLADLALICSNCHRMIHRRANAWLTIEQLSELVSQHRLGN
ncbi:HNH endonuclease [Longispora urticae]